MSNINVSRTITKFLSAEILLHFKTAIGQALTIADAISESEKRRKAIKNLIEQALWEQERRLQTKLLEVGHNLAMQLNEKPIRSPDKLNPRNVFKDPELLVTD